MITAADTWVADPSIGMASNIKSHIVSDTLQRQCQDVQTQQWEGGVMTHSLSQTWYPD